MFNRRSQVSRRQFLGSAVAAAGVVVLPKQATMSRPTNGVTRIAGAGGAVDVADRTSGANTSPSGMDVINSPQYSPLDGLPISFVRSNISAVYDDSIVLDVPAGIGLRTEPGQVPIRITPETEVFARDSYTRGDTTQLLVGDEAAVWTYTDPTSAARGAYFLYANMLQGGLVVSQVNDKNIVGSVLWRFGVPDTTVSVTLAVVDSTTITLRGDGGIAASNEEALAQIPVGSWLGFISVAVDASCDRESLTAISVFPYPWVPVTS